MTFALSGYPLGINAASFHHPLNQEINYFHTETPRL